MFQITLEKKRRVLRSLCMFMLDALSSIETRELELALGPNTAPAFFPPAAATVAVLLLFMKPKKG